MIFNGLLNLSIIQIIFGLLFYNNVFGAQIKSANRLGVLRRTHPIELTIDSGAIRGEYLVGFWYFLKWKWINLIRNFRPLEPMILQFSRVSHMRHPPLDRWDFRWVRKQGSKSDIGPARISMNTCLIFFNSFFYFDHGFSNSGPGP